MAAEIHNLCWQEMAFFRRGWGKMSGCKDRQDKAEV